MKHSQNMEKSFAELLTQFMKRLPITNEKLAGKIISKNQKKDQLGVATGTISRWRNGNYTPNEREYVLDMIEPLKLNLKESNQLFSSLTWQVLDEETWQKYRDRHSKNDKRQQPQPAASNNEQQHESSDSEKLAEIIFADYIKKLFPKLQLLTPHPVMLLFNQAHWDEPPCRLAILAQAEENYPNNVLNLEPPSHCVDVDDCFAKLAQNSGIVSVSSGYDFKLELKRRLQTGNRLFLLVSRFEKASPLLAEELASMIRNFSETYSDRFHVMLCGGKRLADLKYQQIGLLSLLDFATVEYWPELGIKEVKTLYQHRYEKEKVLDDNVTEELLKISGGHPQLLNQCFRFQQHSPNDWRDLTDYSNKLSKSEEVWQLFTPFLEKEKETLERLRELLTKNDKPLLGNWQPDIVDKLLRELYWKNLLVWRDKDDEPGEKELCWRCEAVRMAGEKIFG